MKPSISRREHIEYTENDSAEKGHHAHQDDKRMQNDFSYLPVAQKIVPHEKPSPKAVTVL
jgi:hypothetical protein